MVTQIITLWPQAEGYEHIRVHYDSAMDQQPVRATLNRLVPISGQVVDVEGKPVDDIEMKAMGRGRSHNQFRNMTRTDSEGRYEMELAPHQIYLLTVSSDQWAAAPQTGFAVYPDSPLENRNFQLRRPTRVHGRLLNERTQEPIANRTRYRLSIRHRFARHARCGTSQSRERTLLPAANRVWEQDDIWGKMDHRWTGAKEIMAENCDDVEGGIPWFVILDADGKKLATSNSLESGKNIGFQNWCM